MKMKRFQVRVGGLYVNERKGLIREITEEDANGYAHWRSYTLSNGEPTGDSLMCSPGTIIQWADREATPEEGARIKRSEATARESIRVLELMYRVLQQVPDEQLFAEVRRRGRTVI